MFDAYNILKERLLITNQLTPVQKAAKLMALPDLGARRPSQLLADLLQLCPPGEQNTAFFRASFLQRLPAGIQVHLAHTDTLGLKELAQRADQLTLTNSRPEALMAAVAAEPAAEDSIAAANSKPGKAGQAKKKKKLVTFCWVHHKFGKMARRCDNPAECMWEEN
jgi:hypothetical protein